MLVADGALGRMGCETVKKKNTIVETFIDKFMFQVIKTANTMNCP